MQAVAAMILATCNLL